MGITGNDKQLNDFCHTHKHQASRTLTESKEETNKNWEILTTKYVWQKVKTTGCRQSMSNKPNNVTCMTIEHIKYINSKVQWHEKRETKIPQSFFWHSLFNYLPFCSLFNAIIPTK